ncbi:MAG: hypothetical protein ACKVS8_06915 [Phycisphaerales bacterium]
MHTREHRAWLLPLAVLGIVHGAAAGPAPDDKPSTPGTPPATATPALTVSPAGVASDEADPFAPVVREFNRKRAQFEKELRQIRTKHFANTRGIEIRQAGIAKVRAYTQPEAFAPMIRMFAHDEADVREAVLDHLAEQADGRADAVLAWHAVHDGDETLRAACRERLVKRSQSGPVAIETQSVIAGALASSDPAAAAQGGELAAALSLYEAMPMMIRAQINQQQAAPPGGGGGIGVGGAGTGSQGDGALALIVIGRQTTFVADLTPVVGQSAVGFDPQIGVIAEGTVLRVVDAVAFLYNASLHNTLTRWSSAAWGQSTEHLGWDQNAWLAWYEDEFLPDVARKGAPAMPAP